MKKLLATIALLILCVSAYGLDETDLLFYAPFEGSIEAKIGKGGPAPVKQPEKPPRFVKGLYGKAVVVGKKNEFFAYPFKGNVPEVEGTMSFWVSPVEWQTKATELPFTWLLGIKDPTHYLGFRYHSKYGQPFFIWANGGPLEGIYMGFGPQKGHWHNFVTTYNPSKVVCYIDGELIRYAETKNFINTDYVPAEYNWVNDHFYVPKPLADFLVKNNVNNELWICWPNDEPDTAIDEVMIFNRALTEPEVKSIWRQGVLGARPPFFKLREKEKAEDWVVYEPPALAVSKTDKPPAIDGIISPGEWKYAASAVGFLDGTFGNLIEEDIRALITYDDDNLYVAVQTKGEMRTPLTSADAIDRIEQSEDEIALLIDPGRKKIAANVIRLSAGNAGGFLDSRGTDLSWQCKNLKLAASSKDRLWTVEFSIPFASIGMKPESGDARGINIVRRWAEGPHCLAAWADIHRTPEKFFDPAYYASITFEEDTPVVQLDGLGDVASGILSIAGNCIDPARKPVGILARANLHRTDIRRWYDYYPRSNGKVLSFDASIAAAAGKTGEVKIEKQFFDTDINGLFISFTDNVSQQVLYKQLVPFVLTPPILAVVKTYPSFGYLEVTADISAYHKIPHKELKAEIEVIGADGKSAGKAALESFKEGKAAARMNILNQIPEGKTKVIVTLMKKSGEAVSTFDTEFTKIPKPYWVGLNLGTEDKVLKPFTPLEVEGQKVSVWGRRYTFDDSLLPVQITSAGKTLLAAPMEISSTEDFRNRKNPARVRATSKSPTKALLETEGTIEEVPVTVKVRAEYDGMLFMKMTLAPQKPTELKGLYLSIPMKIENAALYHYNLCGFSGGGKSGAVMEEKLDELKSKPYPKRGVIDIDFNPFVWLGDEERGLEWFCEKQENWVNKGPEKPITMRNEGDITRLIVRLIDNPIEITSPTTFEFGVIATPVKKLPGKWRFFRCGREYGYTWSTGWANTPSDTETHPRYFRPTYKDFVKQKKEFVKYFIQYQWVCTATDRLEELPYYGPEWEANIFYGERSACTGSSYADLYLADFLKFFDECQPDGSYYDGGPPLKCVNLHHGHGWIDQKGRVQPQFTILSHRKFFQRIATELERRRDRYIIWVHNSDIMCMPAFSFATMFWNGEQWSSLAMDNGGDYTKVISLPHFRAEFISQNWGVITQWLGEFHTHGAVKEVTRDMVDTMLLFGLTHGTADHTMASNSGGHWNYMRDVLEARDAFGIQEAEFLPYWNNSDLVKVKPENDKIVCSLWKRPGKALVVLGNFTQKDVSVSVTLDPEKLGLSGKLTAYDLWDKYVDENPSYEMKTHWNGRAVKVAPQRRPLKEQELSDNTLTAPVRKANWRLIVIEQR